MLPLPPGNTGAFEQNFCLKDIWPKDQLTANANSIQWIRILTYFPYSVVLGNLIILKVVGKCEMYQNKKSQEIPGFDEKFLPRGWGFDERWKLENTAGPRFGWFFIGGKSVSFKNWKTFGFFGQIILQ